MKNALLLLALALPSVVDAQDAEPQDTQQQPPQLQYLVPELQGDPFKVTPEAERFQKRLTVSPAAGMLGDGRLYVFRLGYSPNTWLGYEASIGHAPGSSVDALFHMLSAIVRYPLSGRLQPYGVVGYGMMLVFPGTTQNADPVTENTLSFGGGLEFAIRNDFGIRGEFRHVTVLGGDPYDDGTVAYRYGEATLGFVFHRKLGQRNEPSDAPASLGPDGSGRHP